MEQLALEVSNMRSRDCEWALTTALINEPGVEWATADQGAGFVLVRFDPAETTLDRLREAVTASGYEAPSA